MSDNSEISHFPKDGMFYDAITSIIEETSFLRGQNYFTSILQQFHRFANTDYVFVGRLIPEKQEIETVALLKGDQLLENFTYKLQDTPCDIALDRGVCAYGHDVCVSFPNDQLLIDMHVEGYIGTTLKNASGEAIGILVALYEKPIENLSFNQSLFTFFAGQVATALVNHELHTRLEDIVAEQTCELKAEYEKKELALNVSEKLFNFSPDALIQVGVDGNIIRLNTQVESMLGYAQQELIGKPIEVLVPAAVRERHVSDRNTYFTKMERRVMGLSREVVASCKDGTDLPVEITLGSVLDINGELTVLASLRDVTARRHLEESLIGERNRAEFLAKQKSRFLANMSHEIRTPMNGVLGLTELLETTELDSLQKEYLELIKSSGQTLLTVINDILDYSKITEGKLYFEMKSYDFRKWVGGLLFPYRLNTEQTVCIESHIDPKIATYMRADTARMQQLFANLLNNAVKFTHGGSITFSVELVEELEGKQKLHFSVADTGIGISKEAQYRVFGNFEQADASTSREYGGTGLGLSICKELVKLSKGEIWVESEVGKGSTFHVELTFPIADSEAQGVDHSEVSAIKNLRVLLAEDNPTNQVVTKGMLKKLGVTSVSSVENGQEAVDLVCSDGQRFDLILMDCEMPVMDGYEATRKIRRWEEAGGRRLTPICALTAHALDEHRKRSQQAGMNFHLAKPLELGKLRAFCENFQ
ncbi:MAG: response regulator [Cellvibrionaceae bacterium]